MDLRQLENMIAIEEEQSISKAAAKLFITQSALNQQLLKLEKELGTEIFERKNRTMAPTYAGSIYLEAAHRMLELKKETYRKIQDVVEESAGEISVAFTPEKGAEAFARVFPLFHKKYPNVQFHVQEARSKGMEQMVLQRKVNFAFLVYNEATKMPDFEYLDFMEEHLLLVVPITHPLAELAGKRSWETRPITDIKKFENDIFVIPTKDTRARDLVNLLFRKNGIQPNILFEANNTLMQIRMAQCQACLAFVPESYAVPDDKVVYFNIQSEPIWTRGMIKLPETYISRPEQFFIDLNKMYNQGNIPENEYDAMVRQ